MSIKSKGPVKELERRLDAAQKRCDELEGREAELRDSLLRAAADFDNYRKRMQQEMADIRKRGVEAVLCDLIPVFDNLDRAMAVDTREESVEAVKKGVLLIQRQLRDTLEAHGLRQYSCRGEVFDPRRAEAVGFVSDNDAESETVVDEECCGYVCGDRVIRPARVVVARPSQEDGREQGRQFVDNGRLEFSSDANELESDDDSSSFAEDGLR